MMYEFQLMTIERSALRGGTDIHWHRIAVWLESLNSDLYNWLSHSTSFTEIELRDVSRVTSNGNERITSELLLRFADLNAAIEFKLNYSHFAAREFENTDI